MYHVVVGALHKRRIYVAKRHHTVFCQPCRECNGVSFGYADDLLPDSFYAGITGCEGRCRFYDFKVKAGLPELSDEAAALADGEH